MAKYSTHQELTALTISLTRDKTPVSISLDVGKLMVIMSTLLEMATDARLAPLAQAAVLDLAREVADTLEAVRPDSEPYIAYQFGLVVMRRAKGFD